MKRIRVQDKYNSNKIWLVKVSKCGHYYFNQVNCGQRLNKGFKRITKRYLMDIGINL